MWMMKKCSGKSVVRTDLRFPLVNELLEQTRKDKHKAVGQGDKKTLKSRFLPMVFRVT